MNQYKKMAKNTVWFAIGSFGSKIITFLMVPLYTHVLNRGEFGQVDIFNTTLSLLIPFLSLNLFSSIIRFTLDKKEDKSTILMNTLVTTLIFYGIFYVFTSLFVSVDFFVQYNLYFYSILIAALFAMAFSMFAKGIGKVHLFSIGGILETVTLVGFNLVFLLVLNMGVKGYFLSILLSKIMTAFFLLISCKIYKYIDFRKLSKSKLKEMLLFSLPLLPNSLNFWIMNVSDRYILSYFLGYEATGIYSASYKIPTIITVINTIFYQAWQISAIENMNSEKRDKFYSNVFKVNMGLILIMTSGLLMILKPFMSVYVAPDYFIAYKYVPFLLISTIFASFSSFFGIGYLTSKKTKNAFTTSIFGSMANIAINIVFIPIIGIQAAAISTLIAFFVMWVARVFQTKKYYNIKVDYLRLISSLIIIFVQTYLVISKEEYSLFLQLILFVILLLLFIKEEKIIFKKAINYVKNKRSK
ncbi:lipopolysaccharide biosynthesis protein [Oceanotoga teriensis]|jgi:O-antigen/teichoic acid export membrane protein|uniref:lipopolysaccharide biosynthesis protein n=1 Tax=Oceanotoga teriensis TaxID=515440 RepID=UPI002713DC3D|nr:oligosaccharide flippase family protein [Oceanotoga teriensis]MDO7975820.1 oligosaccharide flippase family protein [Oceanotoga teriensis]